MIYDIDRASILQLSRVLFHAQSRANDPLPMESPGAIPGPGKARTWRTQEGENRICEVRG